MRERDLDDAGRQCRSVGEVLDPATIQIRNSNQTILHEPRNTGSGNIPGEDNVIGMNHPKRRVMQPRRSRCSEGSVRRGGKAPSTTCPRRSTESVAEVPMARGLPSWRAPPPPLDLTSMRRARRVGHPPSTHRGAAVGAEPKAGFAFMPARSAAAVGETVWALDLDGRTPFVAMLRTCRHRRSQVRGAPVPTPTLAAANSPGYRAAEPPAIFADSPISSDIRYHVRNRVAPIH
jgi:hypothetical protein